MDYFAIISVFILSFQISLIKSENSISNLMKRMAPYTKSDLPRGTKYFIKKHQLIKSTGIEMEEDGQIIKLHPDLNGTQADLFPEFTIPIMLKDIKLEIFLNASSTSQWSSQGYAQFCVSSLCDNVTIDEASRFKGMLKSLSLTRIFDSNIPYMMMFRNFESLKNVTVYGSLMDIYNSEATMIGDFQTKDYEDCRISIWLQRIENVSLSNNLTSVFLSLLHVKLSCLGKKPSKLIANFIDDTYPNYLELDKMTKESEFLQNNSTLTTISYNFKKKCRVHFELLDCENDVIIVPEISISIWAPDDLDFKSPSIQIKMDGRKTEISSKNISKLSEEFFENNNTTQPKPMMEMLNFLNLTSTKKISYVLESNNLQTHFSSVENGQTCMLVSGLSICNWRGILQIPRGAYPKCSLLKIHGMSKAPNDETNIGEADILIRPDCENIKLPKYHMILNLNKSIMQKLLEYFGTSLNTNDELLKIFDLRNLYKIKSLISERISNNIDEFLSAEYPFVINGYSSLLGLNGSVPFTLNINTNSEGKLTFQSLCLYLNKLFTFKFISKLTSLNEQQLPPMLQDSSLCVKKKPNISLTKNDILINLPINVLSKCFTTDLLCPFLNFISGSKWKGIIFEGVLKDTCLDLKTPITPEGDLFSKFNLTSCYVNYQLKRPENIKIFMKCSLYLYELGQIVSIYFVPEYIDEELKIFGYINHKSKSSVFFFGIDKFKYKKITTKFKLSEQTSYLIFKGDLLYSEKGINSVNNPPKAYMYINLRNRTQSYAHIILPPFSIVDIGKIFGFGDCGELSDLITDTLDEWDIKVKGYPIDSNNFTMTVRGLNFVQNILFNSSIKIHDKLEYSKITLTGIQPIIIPINNINHQAVLTSYTDSKEGPSIFINIECACENTCHMNLIGDAVGNIALLGMNSAIKINLTYTTPWEGSILSYNFLNQQIKVQMHIKLYSFDSPLEFEGILLDLQNYVLVEIQKEIVNNSKHVIQKTTYLEKELDNILNILNKIRSEKIDIQLKLEESRKILEEDMTNEIVYETSLNLTCREELCERVCFGCALMVDCVSKDILGSCVSFSVWDKKCGCGRDPLCLLYNEACDEILELSKISLRQYQDKKFNQKNLYDFYKKKFDDISKDEAKIEMLYSSAIKISYKTVKEIKDKITEAQNILKDIPIVKWLKISDILISSKSFGNKTIEDRLNDSFNEVCVYVKMHFNTRENKLKYKNLKYCPSVDGRLLSYLQTQITKELFPHLYNIGSEFGKFNQDLNDLDSNLDFKTSEPNKYYSKRFLSKITPRSQVERIRRSNTNEMFLKRIIHRGAENGQVRQIIGLNISSYPSNETSDINEETRWSIPHSTHGKCRIFLNVIEIINDLLKIMNQIYLYHNRTIRQFNKQKLNIYSNKNYYVDKLKDVGDLLDLLKNQNSSFQRIIFDFSYGVDLYVKNMDNGIQTLDQNVWDKWKAKLSERIKTMGGKGLERFLQNLIDVIKTLIKPTISTNSLFSKFQKHNWENIFEIVKGIKEKILLNDISKREDINKVNEWYSETKKLKKGLKKSCKT